ncbi:DNA-3-methyladenine glycosylase I [Arachnia propionica]|uniref:DNA-3-methyladenine glycosylase I n=1 Tax=Arachnia propionica TaxID=1750 RepID=A0A3P1T816_9ACTN|nr:DNA-3-methyladenine glycosylase I [Arachnia propionica]RRD05480.1 DNA-3-methyladenine glycosylase I [Arachnia propionica]
MERCFGTGDPLYERYHDEEWGRLVPDEPDEAPLFERIALEGFQAGLSWVTVLRKREAFRRAFADFHPGVVAAYGEDDVTRLMGDPTLIRNERKIRAAINNARAVVVLHGRGMRLGDLLREHAPEPRASPPRSPVDIPGSTPESEALSVRLKELGFRLVGPVTMYATLQAVGLVNDHLAGCPWRHGPPPG